jgi:hypothetical protein
VVPQQNRTQLPSSFPLLQPFEHILPCIRQINDLLERLVTWPRELGHAIFTCRDSFPAP